jgi:Tol biopolymer transport system component
MTNDLDRDLRELFRRHEGDMAGRGLEPPPMIARRTRRRQAITLFMVSIAAAAVAVAGFAGLDAIRASDRRPADPGPGPKIDWERVPSVTIDEDAIVNIRTGEVSQLPASITSLGATHGYRLAPAGDVLVFHASTGSSTDDIFTSCGGGNDGAPPFRACQIFVANLDGTDIRQLTDIPGGATAGGWSPDGTKIVAFLDGDVRRTDIELVIIDVATGETTRLASGPAVDFASPHFSPDGQQIRFSRFTSDPTREGPSSDLFQIPVGGGDVSPLEDRWDATLSPDGGRMVYEKSIFVDTGAGGWGGVELWLADADGTDPRPLVDDEAFSHGAMWSPDGSRLVYSRFAPALWMGGQSGVVVLDLESGTPILFVRAAEDPEGIWLDNETVLVDGYPAADGPTPPPSPTPSVDDGAPATVDWESVPGISIEADAMVDIRTGRVTPLPTGIASLQNASGFAVAPGGDALLFEASAGGSDRNQISVANVDGTNARQLTDASGGASDGAWSPDGMKIAAVLYLEGGSRDEAALVLIDVATGEATQLATGDIGIPRFSPDGRVIRFLSFAKREGNDSDILEVPVEGGDVTLVHEDVPWNATLSPDGRRIVYTEWVTVGNVGGQEIWVADADGTDPRPLVSGDEPFSDNPSWSPDGTRIVFTKWRQRADELVAVVEVADGTPTFTVHAPESALGVWLDNETILVNVQL